MPRPDKKAPGKELQVRLEEARLPSNGKRGWVAEAGWPFGGALIYFAGTITFPTKREALEALHVVLTRRMKHTQEALVRLGLLMLENGYRVSPGGMVKRQRGKKG